jgi:hypothetical protein
MHERSRLSRFAAGSPARPPLKFRLAQLGKVHTDIGPQRLQRARRRWFDPKKHLANSNPQRQPLRIRERFPGYVDPKPLRQRDGALFVCRGSWNPRARAG